MKLHYLVSFNMINLSPLAIPSDVRPGTLDHTKNTSRCGGKDSLLNGMHHRFSRSGQCS